GHGLLVGTLVDIAGGVAAPGGEAGGAPAVGHGSGVLGVALAGLRQGVVGGGMPGGEDVAIFANAVAREGEVGGEVRESVVEGGGMKVPGGGGSGGHETRADERAGGDAGGRERIVEGRGEIDLVGLKKGRLGDGRPGDGGSGGGVEVQGGGFADGFAANGEGRNVGGRGARRIDESGVGGGVGGSRGRRSDALALVMAGFVGGHAAVADGFDRVNGVIGSGGAELRAGDDGGGGKAEGPRHRKARRQGVVTRGPRDHGCRR